MNTFKEYLFMKALSIHEDIFGERDEEGYRVSDGRTEDENLWGRIQILEEIIEENNWLDEYEKFKDDHYYKLSE